MPPANPFSAFSIEDQSNIQDQLSAAYSSGHLNPVQRISVGNALRNMAGARTALPVPEGLSTPPALPMAPANPDQSTISAYEPSNWDKLKAAIPSVGHVADILSGRVNPMSSMKPQDVGQLIYPERTYSATDNEQHPIRTASDEFLGSLTSPDNLLLMQGLGAVGMAPGVAGKILPRAASAVFAGQMGKGAYDTGQAALQNWDRYKQTGDQHYKNEALRLGTHAILGVGMTGLAAGHVALGDAEPKVTPSEAPQSVTPAETPKSVITPESPKQSIEPEYVGDTVSASSTPAAPADASPSAAASDLARPTTPSQPEIAPMETPSKPTENTAQSIPTLQDVANGWRQVAQAGPSPERQLLADMALNPVEDAGTAIRQQMPPMPRGERRAIPRTPDEIQTQQLFGQAREELGDNATSDQIMARVEELKQPSVTPEPLPLAPKDPFATVPTDLQAQAQAKAELGSAIHPDFLRRAQEIKTQMLAEQAAPTPTRYEAQLIPNGSGESAASVEAINRLSSEKAAGTRRVVVDTRSGVERPLLGTDAVDYQPKQYESVEFRGGSRDGEVIDQGKNARPYQRKGQAIASAQPTAIAKSETTELPSARIQRNLDVVNRLLEGDAAIKQARETRRTAIPQEVIENRKMRVGLRAKLAKIRQNPGMADQIPVYEKQIADLTAREQHLVQAYRSFHAGIGDQQTTRYTKVNYSPELNDRLSEEGKANAAAKIQERIDAAHEEIRQELKVTTDPKRRAQLERHLTEPVIKVAGKPIRSDVNVAIGKNGPELQTQTPELSLKTIRTLRNTVGNGKPLASMLDLVHEDQRDAVRALHPRFGGDDATAYHEAVQSAARAHVEGIRNNLKQQLEAAKAREATPSNVFKPSTATRNILSDLKAGKRTISDLSDNEIDHLLDNRGVVSQEFGPSERMAKKGENGQGTVLQKNPRPEQFLDRLTQEKAERQKAIVEGQITPHEAMDFAQTLQDHVASGKPLSEEGNNTLAELNVDVKKPAQAAVKLGEMADRAHDEAGFMTAGMLFDLRKLPGEAWRQYLADPVLKRIGMGDKFESVRGMSPALADLFKRRAHAPQALRDEAFQNVKNIVGDTGHAKERLAVLMSDANSRENLRVNHPAEYAQAVNDPQVQGIMRRYKSYAQELTDQRMKRGGATVSDDYVRRVYDNHISESGAAPYEKAVSGRGLPNQQRKASAEYYYQKGTHEFGPSYGSKYVSEGLISLDKDIVQQMLNEGTIHPKDQPLPNSINYSDGKTYYSPEQAKIIGSKDVYSRFDPLKTLKFKIGDHVILAPKDIVDMASATEQPPKFTPNWAIRSIQKGVIGLSGGIPHVANIARRTINSFEGGMVNPRGAKAVFKVLFDKELRQRAEAGPSDPTMRELARRGATRFDLENSLPQSKNPLMRFGHDLLYKPGSVGGLGGIQQRAQMYYADRLIHENPKMTWDQVSQNVENLYGKASKQNWTKTQQTIGNLVPFPGWLYSSIQQGLKHPLRATVGAAAMIYGLNQAINKMGGNRQEDAQDISRIHVGDYSFSPTVFNEPFAKVVAGPALDAAQTAIRGGSNREIGNTAMRSVVRSGAKSLNTLLPYYAAPLEVMYNRPFAGTEKEIFNDEAWDQKGKSGLPVAVENIVKHVGTRIIPQMDRVVPEGQASPSLTSSLIGLAGSQVGLATFRQDAQSRLLRNLASTGEASHTVDTYKAQRPTDLPQLFQNEPALALDNSFHAQFEVIQKRLKQIDDAEVAMPDKKAELDTARTALLSAADEINDTYQKVREQQINAKTDKPIDKIKQGLKRVSGL